MKWATSIRIITQGQRFTPQSSFSINANRITDFSNKRPPPPSPKCIMAPQITVQLFGPASKRRPPSYQATPPNSEGSDPEEGKHLHSTRRTAAKRSNCEEKPPTEMSANSLQRAGLQGATLAFIGGRGVAAGTDLLWAEKTIVIIEKTGSKYNPAGGP